MQKVTQKWKSNQERQISNEGFVEVSYSYGIPDLPPDETFDNTLPGTEIKKISQTEKLVSAFEKMTKYSGLEQKFWLLDGSFSTLPDNDNSYSGYMSGEICDENCKFSNNPIVTIDFTEIIKASIPGFTITWGAVYDEYATEFKIYVDGIEKGKFENSKTVTPIQLELSDFDEISIEILEWSKPHHRARIARVFFGIDVVYEKDILMKFSASEFVDPLTTSLPKYELRFELDNIDRKFDLDNPDGVTKYMMEKQEIRTRYGFRVSEQSEREYIDGGTYFLSGWTAPQNGISATFTARDLLGFMGKKHTLTIPLPKVISLHAMATAVLREANLPPHRDGGDMWILDTALTEISTVAALPECSIAEALQLIANAGMCVIFFDRQGKLHIERQPVAVENDLEIHGRNAYSKPEIELASPLQQIDITLHQHELGKEVVLNAYEDEETGEIVEGYKFTVSSSTYLSEEWVIPTDADDVRWYIDWTTPPSNYAHSTEYKNNSAIENFAHRNGNKIYFNASPIGRGDYSGTFFIKYKPLKITEKNVLTIKNSDVAYGETQTLKNQLITSEEHAMQVGQWMLEHLKKRKKASVDYRVDPRLDVLDVVRISVNKEKLNTAPQMIVTSSSLDFTGAFKGKVEGVIL